MTVTATAATAERVLAQLRRDPRTIALVLLAPVLLLWLLKLMVDQRPGTFDRLGAPLIGLLPFIQMFLISAITVMRERTSGTLERLMAMPIAKLDLLAGYALAFALLAAAQALLTSAVAFLLLDLDVSAPAWAIISLALANALLGMALGLLASTLATTEFQATEFMPAFVLPQLLLCGLLVPRDQTVPALETIARALPLTYAFDALDRLANQGPLGTTGTIEPHRHRNADRPRPGSRRRNHAPAHRLATPTATPADSSQSPDLPAGTTGSPTRTSASMVDRGLRDGRGAGAPCAERCFSTVPRAAREPIVMPGDSSFSGDETAP